MKKYSYFKPNAKVWVHAPKLTDKYPGVVVQRQSGVYRVRFVETGDVWLIAAKYLTERRV